MNKAYQLFNAYRSYDPEGARKAREDRKGRTFGAFKPTYLSRTVLRPPRSDAEAQELYNHSRTVCFVLDDSPVLADFGLPFKAGLDDIISLIPLYGDALSALFGLYFLYLAFLFGCPWPTLGWMLVNVLVDFLVGIVPIIGDVLDNLWKSNIKNLGLLEDHLLRQKRHTVLLMPKGGDFIPKPKRSFWGGGGRGAAGQRKPPKADRSRRMEAWEGEEGQAQSASSFADEPAVPDLD